MRRFGTYGAAVVARSVSGGSFALIAGLAVVCGSQDASAQGSRTPLTPPRATRVSYSPEQTRGLIDDLGMGDFSRRSIIERDIGTNTGAPTKEIRAVRPLIAEFADEISQLGYDLNDALRRNPSIRQLLTDAMKVSAMAVSLSKTVERVNDHTRVIPDFQDLDAKWRELSYRLTNVTGLDRKVVTRIDALNDLNSQIDDAIGMRPQLNRRELAQKTYDLATDLKNLIEDIQVELGGRESQQFQLGLSRVRQQVLNIADLLEDSTVDTAMITEEYKQFQTLWYPQRAKLQEYDSRYFERSLRRITQTDGEIHQLLLLPTKVDTQQLVYLTSALRKDIDEFFDRTSLKLLMHLPRADRVAGVASEFYGVCEHFIDEVESGAKYDQLVDSFRYIEDAQHNFVDLFYDIKSDEALAALHQIEQTLAALSSALQVQQDHFDRTAAIDRAATVETLTDQLEWAAKRWFSNDRQPFANDCLRAIADMRSRSAKLHQDLVTNASLQELRNDSEDLYDNWRTVYNYLVKCQTADRTTLGRLSSRLTPALVDVRTMLAQ